MMYCDTTYHSTTQFKGTGGREGREGRKGRVRLIYTFLPGISWNVLEDSMDFQEFPSHSMGFHVPNYVILHSLSRTFHRIPYCSILFHDLPQGSMEFPDIPGDSILFHWILWGSWVVLLCSFGFHNFSQGSLGIHGSQQGFQRCTVACGSLGDCCLWR